MDGELMERLMRVGFVIWIVVFGGFLAVLGYLKVKEQKKTRREERKLGGVGPFLLQRKASIDDPTWQRLAESAERSVAAPISDPMSLFRIVDLGAGQ